MKEYTGERSKPAGNAPMSRPCKGNYVNDGQNKRGTVREYEGTLDDYRNGEERLVDQKECMITQSFSVEADNSSLASSLQVFIG